MWLNRRQVRWLVILLALLPVVPTVMTVQLMIEKAERERADEVALETGAIRDQTRHLVERSARGEALAEAARERTGDREAMGDALFGHLHRIFGEQVALSVSSPDGGIQRERGDVGGRDLVVSEIQGGPFAGWRVILGGIITVPEEFDRELIAAWWRAGGIVVGVVVVAGVVWLAVHRGLRVDELRGDLLTTVSHEMKTPLASMRVLLETLADEDSPVLRTAAQRRDYLDLVVKENQRLSRLAEDFLTFARLERGEARLKIESCPLREIVAEVCAELRPAIERAGAVVDNAVDAGHIALGDRTALGGVIRNLVENSLKYGTGPDGSPPRVLIDSVSDPGRRVSLRVTDGGVGIPAELRRHVFHRWFRVDSRLAGGGSGVGLGLAICRQFTRRMGGRIGIEETSDEGQGGCRFRVRLRCPRDIPPAAISLLHPNPDTP